MEDYEEELEIALKKKIQSLTEKTSQELENKINHIQEIIEQKIKESFEVANLQKNEICKNLLYHEMSLLDYILICLSNMKPLVSLFLGNKQKYLQQKINKINKNNLFNLFVDLFNNLWFKKNNQYDAIEMHKYLNTLNKNIYYSKDPGQIMGFLLDKLNDELKFNKNQNKENIDVDRSQELKAFENFKLVSKQNKTDISEMFSIIYKVIKTCNVCETKMYFFEKMLIVNLYIEEIRLSIVKEKKAFNEISLIDTFNFLLNDNKDQEEFCKGCEYIQKMKINNSIEDYDNDILIININRDKDPNHIMNLAFKQTIQLLKKEKNYKYKLISVLNKNYEEKDQKVNLYCNNFNNNKWYLYNKNGVNLEEKEEEYLDGFKVLLLVYQRVY